MAVDLAEKQTQNEKDEETPFPEDGAHVIVVDHSGFDGFAPEGHEANRLSYERGDELPLEQGKQVATTFPHTLAVLNEDGELVSGGVDYQGSQVQEAINIWNRGEGFDPTEYEE